MAEDDGYDSARLRRAISMSLDRTELIKLVPGDTLVPATGWIPPGVGGYEASRCGTTGVHDPNEADAPHNSAGDYPGTIQITFGSENPATSTGSVWSAVCREITAPINEPCTVRGVPGAEFHQLATSDRTTDLLALNHRMNYPSIDDFLRQLYSRAGGLNFADYLSAPVNEGVRPAAGRTSIDEAFRVLPQHRGAARRQHADRPALVRPDDR